MPRNSTGAFFDKPRTDWSNSKRNFIVGLKVELVASSSLLKSVKIVPSATTFPGTTPSGTPKVAPPETIAWNDGVRSLNPSVPALMSMPLVFQNRVFSFTKVLYSARMNAS